MDADTFVKLRRSADNLRRDIANLGYIAAGLNLNHAELLTDFTQRDKQVATLRSIHAELVDELNRIEAYLFKEYSKRCLTPR